MRSNVTKLAAAAAILISIAALATRSSSLKITTPAFGMEEVRSAMKQAEYTHFLMKVEQSNLDAETAKRLGIGDFEGWQSLHPPRSIEKRDDGRLACGELDTGKIWRYDPVSRIITVEQGTPKSPEELSMSPVDSLTKSVSEVEKIGGQIERTTGDYQGRRVTVIRAEVQVPNSKLRFGYSLTVDPKTYLILRISYEQEDQEKGWKVVMAGVVDYPNSAPADIYAVGAPRDAKVVSLSRVGDSISAPGASKAKATEITKSIAAPRNRLPKRWILTVATTSDNNSVRNISMDYVDGLKERWENRGISGNAVSADSIPISAGLPAVRRWAHGLPSDRVYEYLSDGSYKYSTTYLGPQERWFPNEKEKVDPKFPHSGAWNVESYGWPVGGEQFVEDANAAKRGLVRVELRSPARVNDGKLTNPATKRVYFLDPNRDYMCVRSETYTHVMPLRSQPRLDELDFEPGTTPDAPTSVKDVIEFGRMENGLWYPKKLREVSTTWVPVGRQLQLGQRTDITTVYLETDPVFPPGVFDPNQFPEWKP